MSSSFGFIGEYEVTEEEGTHDVVGPCLIERREKLGLLHSINDQPSIIYRHPDTREIFRREWHDYGLPERANDLPTVIDESGKDTLRMWHKDGWPGRPRGPAITWTAPTGVIVREEFLFRGEKPIYGVAVLERDRHTGKEVAREVAGLEPDHTLTP